MFFPVSSWAPAFALTLAIELPITTFLFRRGAPDIGRLVIVVVFANLATHLAVWYVFTQLLFVGTPAYLVASEAWAVAGETLIYWAALPSLSLRRIAVVALAANLTSFVAGRLISTVGAAIW